MRHRQRLAALVMAAGAATTLTVAAQPAHATDYFDLFNGLCLQPTPGSTAADLGAPVVQEHCDFHDTTQHWELLFDGGGHVRFRNQGTGLCLDARGGATDGTPVQQWTCNSISNERWTDIIGDSQADQPDQIRSNVSGTNTHCLDVPNQSKDPGVQVQLWRCNGTIAQDWFIL